jgi:DNA polymerase-3 subunit beta
METTLRLRLAGVVGQPVRLLVPAKRLHEAVRSLPGDDVTLREHDGKLIVAARRDKVTIGCFDPADFPVIATDDDPPIASAQCAAFARALDTAAACMAEERTRYSLNGVFIDTADSLRFVGSEGSMIVYRVVTDKATPLNQHSIIPGKAAKLAAQVLATLDGECDLVVTENHAAFETPGCVLRCQLLAGLYPAYRQVLPDTEKHDIRVTLGRNDLMAALRRLAVAKGETEKGVGTTECARCRVTPTALHLTMRGDDATADSTVDCESTLESGMEMEIGLDRGKLVAGLTGAPDRVTLMMRDHEKAPVVIEDDGFLYMLMPMELS